MVEENTVLLIELPFRVFVWVHQPLAFYILLTYLVVLENFFTVLATLKSFFRIRSTPKAKFKSQER